MPNSPIHIPKYGDTIMYNTTNNGQNPIGINSVSSSNSNLKMMDQNIMSPTTVQQIVDSDDFNQTQVYAMSSLVIGKESTPAHLAQWLSFHRLTPYASTFAHFAGADLLRMSKEDLIQICGLADGIRMYNTLHAKYVSLSYQLSPNNFRLISIMCLPRKPFFFFSYTILEPSRPVLQSTLATMVAHTMPFTCTPQPQRSSSRRSTNCRVSVNT